MEVDKLPWKSFRSQHHQMQSLLIIQQKFIIFQHNLLIVVMWGTVWPTWGFHVKCVIDNCPIKGAKLSENLGIVTEEEIATTWKVLQSRFIRELPFINNYTYSSLNLFASNTGNKFHNYHVTSSIWDYQFRQNIAVCFPTSALKVLQRFWFVGAGSWYCPSACRTYHCYVVDWVDRWTVFSGATSQLNVLMIAAWSLTNARFSCASAWQNLIFELVCFIFSTQIISDENRREHNHRENFLRDRYRFCR